jgi:hypothetical protein
MYDYLIADIRLRSDRDLVEMGLRGFKPFATDYSDNMAECTLRFVDTIDMQSLGNLHTLSESYIADSDSDSSFYATNDGYLYSIVSRGESQCPALFYIDSTTNNAITDIKPKDSISLAVLRFGIWVMFGTVLLKHNAVAIHSSVIVAEDQGVLFLGESGTGKSTHTRLWRENIEGARLLNDDSPIVRIVDNEVRVYGSPWSGKTPCYKNEVYPMAGLCRLSQAPYNRITRLSNLMAIGALLPSCPPVFAHDSALQDMICTIVGEIVRGTKCYHLECLPNKEASELSYNTIIRNE